MKWFRSIFNGLGRGVGVVSDGITGRGVSKRLDEHRDLYDEVLIGLYSDVQELRAELRRIRHEERNGSTPAGRNWTHAVAVASLVLSVIAVVVAVVW